MTWQLAHSGPDQLTVRFIPWLTWSFAALVIYGIGTITLPAFTGTQSLTTGEVVTIALLMGMMLFTLVTGGQLGICRIDRRNGKITVTSYGLLGRARQERSLADVKGLEVRVLRRAQYRLLLALRSGERLPLAPFYLVSFNDRGIRRIAAALGVEPEMIQEQRSFR
ncbi:MAG: hypothetical protein NZQ09_14565 [Chloroflexus sp.]|nr:hypothetical protein [Chloroflexus sp.]